MSTPALGRGWQDAALDVSFAHGADHTVLHRVSFAALIRWGMQIELEEGWTVLCA